MALCRFDRVLVRGLSGVLGSALLVLLASADAAAGAENGISVDSRLIQRVVPFEVQIERRARLLKDLRETLKDYLVLTDEQDQELARVFEAHVQSLRELNQVDPEKEVPSDEARPTAEEIVELKKELAEAREAGDQARANQIVRRILYSGKPRPAGLAVFARLSAMPRDMFNQAAAVLPPRKVRPATRIWNRWWTLYPKRPLDNPVDCIMRAVVDPELKIDQELRTELIEKVNESMKRSRPASLEPDEQKEVAQEILAEIKPDLPEYRWGHFIATWEKLAKQAEADYQAFARIRKENATMSMLPEEE